MEIRWLGNSAFLVRGSAGTVLLDAEVSAVASALSEPNTILAYSRTRARQADVPADTKVLFGPGEYEIGGLLIRGVGTPAGNPDVSREINTVYSIDADGLNVVVVGGLGGAPNAQAVQALGDVDLLVVAPAAGPISADDLATVIRNLEPRVVVLSGMDSNGQPSPALKGLLGELDIKQLEPSPRVSYTSKNALPENRLAVGLAQASL